MSKINQENHNEGHGALGLNIQDPVHRSFQRMRILHIPVKRLSVGRFEGGQSEDWTDAYQMLQVGFGSFLFFCIKNRQFRFA